MIEETNTPHKFNFFNQIKSGTLIQFPQIVKRKWFKKYVEESGYLFLHTIDDKTFLFINSRSLSSDMFYVLNSDMELVSFHAVSPVFGVFYWDTELSTINEIYETAVESLVKIESGLMENNDVQTFIKGKQVSSSNE